MIEAPLAVAFTAGMVAAVNPCGFPMLPAYLSFFIGTDDDGADRGGRVPRAVLAATAVSLGFLGVFVALGIPISAGRERLYDLMPWLTILVGIGLVALGLAMAAGWKLPVALPRLDKGGSSRRFGSMVLFGVSYAIASLSCTLPVFLGTVAFGMRASAASGVLTFVAYALGMSAVLMALTVALALAREGLVRRLRAALAHVDRVAAVMLVLVGGYLVWYGIWARDPLNNAATSPLRAVERWSTDAQVWLQQGGAELGLVLVGVVVVGLAAAVVSHRRASAPAGGAAPNEPERV